MNKKIRLSGIAYESLVNGPGIRRVFFAQGCKHNCKGCFNPETHNSQGGELVDMDKLIDDVKNNPILSGVTFSGGDPWEQADKFSYMAKEIRLGVSKTNFNIWCFTGYTYEFILENKNKRLGWNELLQSIDVLVDGKFEEENSHTPLKYRGSSNQRIIDIKKSLSKDDIVIIEY